MALNIQLYSANERHYLSLNDILIICFSLWPLFWNIYVSFSFTAGVLGGHIPVYVLWFITLLAVIVNTKIKKSALWIWLFFIVVALLGSISRLSSTVLINLSVLLCATLFCILLYKKPINHILILKCLIFCGIFIAVTVILDMLFGMFQRTLIGLYTERAANAKQTISVNSGILPYTSSAGGYICMALVSYITLLRIQGRKLRAVSWVVIALLVISFFILRKRGFTLDMILSFAIVWFVGNIMNKKRKINIKRSVQIISAFFAVLIVGIVLYFSVSGIREIVDNYLVRFSTDDTTLSGRTVLYDLAWNRFRLHPVFGIGWGNYRGLTTGIFDSTSDSTYAVHNVYLQLLCETGVVGTVVFLMASFGTLIYGFKKLKSSLSNDNPISTIIIQCGLFFQLFFLTYCMSGNPLYDYNFLVLYFIGILMTVTQEKIPKLTKYLSIRKAEGEV